MTADLAAWLLADDGPIAEDERVARAATAGPGRAKLGGKWVDVPDDGVWRRNYACVEGVGIQIYPEGGHDDDQADRVGRTMGCDPRHLRFLGAGLSAGT